MTAMTLISRRTASVRCEDFGRDKQYHKPVAQWTDYERRCNRIIEDLMIIEGAKLAKRKRAAAEQAEANSNEARRREAWMPILDVMDGPMTSQQIAPLVGRQVSPVANSLKAMEKAGLVSRKEQGRNANGQQMPFIWTRADGLPCHIGNRAKGDKARKAVLDLMDGPTTASQMAEKIGYGAHHCQQLFRELERRGMVKRAGKGPKVNGKGSAPTLWVRA